MGYSPENNPYIPGDPYSYDLKWMVDKMKQWTDPLDSAERAKASEEAAALSAEAADLSAQAAADSASDAKDSEDAAKNYADHIADPVSGLVTDWLADHITQPTTPAIDTSLSVAGAAADAAATGKSMLFKKLNMQYTNNDGLDFDTLPLGSALFMLAPTGNNAPSPSSGIALTMQTNTNAYDAGIEQWYITQTSTPHWYWRRCYGNAGNWQPWRDRFSNYLFAQLNPNYSQNDNKDFDTLPLGSALFMLAPTGNNAPSTNSGIALTMQTNTNAYDVGIEQWYITQTSTPHWYWRRCYGSAGNWQPWVDRLGKASRGHAEARFYAFNQIGFIGDSYTAGGSPSYPQTIATRDNLTSKIYAFGGATTRSWNNTYSAVDPCPAYILALGINDMALGSSYIGTPADIGTAADTFYGNYSKIIELCKTANASARIYITDPLHGVIGSANDLAYIAAIKELCRHYGIYYAPVSETGCWENLPIPDNNHPEALIGYATLASYVSKAIGAAYIPS